MPTPFEDYASYHRTSGNQATHRVGIPMIVIAVLGLLAQWVLVDRLGGSEIFQLDGGILIWILGMLWYLRLDWRLATPFGFVLLGLYFLARAIPVPFLVALFVVGWAIQYVGHYVYEKKSPAFYKNAEHLLVGPIWIFAKIVRR